MAKAPDDKAAHQARNTSRTDQARDVVQEYLDDLRAIIKKLRDGAGRLFQ